MYHIQIVGAGYAGSRIAARFREKKQKVWAITRSGKRNAEFETLGILPVIADLTKPETLKKIPPAHFIVICPAPGEKKDEAAYRQIYLEGIGNYLAAIGKNPKPNLIVYLSSTGVYSGKKGEWVDETTPPEPDTEKGKILLEAEQQVLNSGYPAIVFRLAGIYGPGRSRNIPKGTVEDTVIASPLQFSAGAAISDAGIASPAAVPPRNDSAFCSPRWDKTDRWINLIHVEDIAGAMPVIFNKGQAGSIYLGVDDEPVLESEFSRWLKALSSPHGFRRGSPAKASGDDRVIKGKRCSNQRLKKLGYQFKYPTYREGYEALHSHSRESGNLKHLDPPVKPKDDRG